MVRAKFRLMMKTEAANIPGATLKFETMYDPECPEDDRYCRATPSGTLEMRVDNPDVLQRLKLGAIYYLTFTEGPEGIGR
jgi:hypothetical protein